MLQVTETAASVFRKILDQPDVEATTIRLVPARQEDGEEGIGLQAVDRAEPADQPTQAEGVDVVVAPELAPALDESVLDARPTSDGAELFLRSQDAPS